MRRNLKQISFDNKYFQTSLYRFSLSFYGIYIINKEQFEVELDRVDRLVPSNHSSE